MKIPYNKKCEIKFPNNVKIKCVITKHDTLNHEHCYIIYDDKETNHPITPDDENKFSFMKVWLSLCEINII